eukprot:465602-Amphidinium_carterae.1
MHRSASQTLRIDDQKHSCAMSAQLFMSFLSGIEILECNCKREVKELSTSEPKIAPPSPPKKFPRTKR